MTSYSLRLANKLITGYAWVCGPPDQPGAVRVLSNKTLGGITSWGSPVLSDIVPDDVVIFGDHKASIRWIKSHRRYQASIGRKSGRFVAVRVDPVTRICVPDYCPREAFWRELAAKGSVQQSLTGRLLSRLHEHPATLAELVSSTGGKVKVVSATLQRLRVQGDVSTNNGSWSLSGRRVA